MFDADANPVKAEDHVFEELRGGPAALVGVSAGNGAVLVDFRLELLEATPIPAMTARTRLRPASVEAAPSPVSGATEHLHLEVDEFVGDALVRSKWQPASPVPLSAGKEGPHFGGRRTPPSWPYPAPRRDVVGLPRIRAASGGWRR